jgi:3-oxoacyl-[acyl-carrier protein] reductase
VTLGAARVAVITGAGRGIGRATALELARRGWSLALLGRSDDPLRDVAAEVSAIGAQSRAIHCDVSSPTEVDRAAAEVLAELAVPQLVINNAGVIDRGRAVHETPVASWDQVVGVNLRGPFLICRALLPAMLARGRGRFVQIASISATLGSPGAASYAASKWGVVGLTKSLAEELRGTGLSAVALLPGSVDTEMLVGSGFEPRMSADDVARMIVFLGLDAPDAISGSAVEMFG